MQQVYNTQRLTRHALILYSYVNLSCWTYKDATVKRTKTDTIKTKEIRIQKV